MTDQQLYHNFKFLNTDELEKISSDGRKFLISLINALEGVVDLNEKQKQNF